MNLKKSIILILLVFTFHSYNLVAQDFHVSKSEVFEEPNSGEIQLLQLKNGNTFLLHPEGENGIDVSVYDKGRKLISQKSITGKIWNARKMDDVILRGFYEINGEPVLFFIQENDQKSLYRLRFNAADGTLASEDEIASLDGLPWENFQMQENRTNISVEKDPASDCYAVITSNFDLKTFNQSIKVLHFDGAHKMINEADLKSVGTGFSHMYYSSAVVDGSKRVFVISSGYVGKISFAQTRIAGDCKVVISKLNVGEKVFTNKTMEVNVDLSDVKTQVLYNHNSNRLQLRALSLASSKKKAMSTTVTRYYLSLIAYFDPETLELNYVKPIFAEKVSAYAQSHIDKDYSYTGTPSSMILNNDKTTAILMEEKSSGESSSYLGAIGILFLSDTGSEVGGYAIKKKQEIRNGFDNKRFMSYDFVSTAKGNFVIFNDLLSNFNKDEDESTHRKVAAASVTNAVGYKLNNNSIDRYFLFGEPANNSSTFCYIDGSNYNSVLNTYATVIIERDGRKKQARMAWVTFD